ncbi:MAG TPA: alpha/beta hydrolase [Candidatus Dormibacteraeota bacterium]|nr:alpha/beta hydrolase [Candidatus Dormibacteraeota bacterium]
MRTLAKKHLLWRSGSIILILSAFPVFVCAQQDSSHATSHATAQKKTHKSAKSAEATVFHEDWTTPSLATSTLKPDVPVLGQRDDVPENNFIRERFQLRWRPGDPMDVYVIRPRGVAKPPVVLYLYAVPQDTDRFKNDRWCAQVIADGYAAIGFVSAITGHRAEHRPLKEWFVSELQESLATSAHDVQMILNYLDTRGDLDMNRVGMFGQGSGGTIAILASAADPRIKVLDVLTPWGDWPTWLAKSTVVPDEERAKYLTPEFLERVAPLEPAVVLAKVQARNVRLQNVRKEAKMPDGSQERLEAAAPEITEIDQYGDGRALYPMAAGGKLFDWLKVHLKSDTATPVSTAKSERIHFYPGHPDSIR